MIKVHINVPTLKLPALTRSDWIRIGAKAVQTINERLKLGVGVHDRKMKRLSPAYANVKKKMGAASIRNLMFSGSMLSSMSVVNSTTESVTIGFTRRSEVIKAQYNQNRDPWFGLSKKDEEIINSFAKAILRKR